MSCGINPCVFCVPTFRIFKERVKEKFPELTLGEEGTEVPNMISNGDRREAVKNPMCPGHERKAMRQFSLISPAATFLPAE